MASRKIARDQRDANRNADSPECKYRHWKNGHSSKSWTEGDGQGRPNRKAADSTHKPQ